MKHPDLLPALIISIVVVAMAVMGVVLTIIFQGCTSVAPLPSTATEVATGTTTSTNTETTISPGAIWPTFGPIVAPKVTDKMISSNPGIYCPNYNNVDKKKFWIVFAKSITRAECGWNPNSQMTERFIDGSTGKLAISAGMFQLSVGDKSHGGSCAGLTSTNILDVTKNLTCGMEIQDSLLGSRSTVQESLGRYWSTVRDNKNGTDGISLSATVQSYMKECF